MKKSLVKDALLKATEKYLNEEAGIPYISGQYPTSDDNDIGYHDKVPANKNQHGCQIKLANGDVVACLIVPLSPNIIHAGFTCNGEHWEVFELPKSTSGYYNTFKKKIEDKYETQFVDNDEAKDTFDHYISNIFVT